MHPLYGVCCRNRDVDDGDNIRREWTVLCAKFWIFLVNDALVVPNQTSPSVAMEVLSSLLKVYAHSMVFSNSFTCNTMVDALAIHNIISLKNIYRIEHRPRDAGIMGIFNASKFCCFNASYLFVSQSASSDAIRTFSPKALYSISVWVCAWVDGWNRVNGSGKAPRWHRNINWDSTKIRNCWLNESAVSRMNNECLAAASSICSIYLISLYFFLISRVFRARTFSLSQ